MDVKWKLSILVDAFHKSHGVSCSIQVTDLFRNVWTKHAFTIAFYKPTCPAGFPSAEILFRRVSLVEPWTDLNGPLAVSFGIVKSALIGSKWGPDAQIPALSALPCLALYIHWSLDQKWHSGKDHPIQVTSFLHHCANGLSSFVIPGDVLWIHLLLRQANQ